MENNIEHLQFPIGRYPKPDRFELNDIKQWITVLKLLPSWMDAGIENLDEQQLQIPYREGGWNIQQVIHHVADSHMNAYIRLKLALTEENPTIKPYDEKAWAELEDTKKVPVNISVTLLHSLHRRMVALLENMKEEDWLRTYYHPGFQRKITVWETVALYAWHSRHHTAHIMELRKRLGVN
jgi:uncharacterized damage-inducible protein DinB